MKILKTILAWIILLALIGAVLWGSFTLKDKLAPREEGGAEEAAASPPEEHEEAAEPGHIHVSTEDREHLGLEVQALPKAAYQSSVSGFGLVMDPSPLLALDAEIQQAGAALAASRQTLDREKALFTNGEMTARKNVEAAEAQVHADELKLAALTRRMPVEWGPVAESDPAALARRLASRQCALVRLEIPATGGMGGRPPSATVAWPGTEEKMLLAKPLFPAPSRDVQSQLPAYFALIENPPADLRPGAAVSAAFPGSDPPEEGVLVPAAAVVRHQGLAFVFVAEGEEEFLKRAIDCDHPMEGGYFVHEGLKAGDKVATTGAVHLIAVENKATLGEAD